MPVELPHPENFDTVEQPEIKLHSTRVEYNFDALVARNGMRFAFVEYLFDDSTDNKDLFGAVGHVLRPVHHDEVERTMERYKNKSQSPLYHVYEESEVAQPWSQWIESELAAEGIDLLFDQSHRYKYGSVVEEQCDKESLINPNDIEAIECVRGGRVFSNLNGNASKVYDEELMRIVEKVEDSGLYALEL
jgi:hypothetical protein